MGKKKKTDEIETRGKLLGLFTLYYEPLHVYM